MDVKAGRVVIMSSILPTSCIPSATGTGFLVIGSRMSPCFFPLSLYLIVLGSISLSNPILGGVFRSLLKKALDRDNRIVIAIIKYTSKALVAMEVVLLAAGLVLIIPNLKKWQFEDAENEDTYCDLGTMVIAMAFLSGTWLFLIIGAIAYCVIAYANMLETGRKASLNRIPKSDL